jgi:hypothetical protein
MQFGPSLDKRKIQGLVKDTGWNEFIELNRMAFSDKLPRNSESRAISIAMKMLKKYAPHIKWVISFADACQCGDGTIYRASGFVLTGIKENTQNYKLPKSDKINEALLETKGLNQAEINNIKCWLDSITPLKESIYCHKLTVEDRPPNTSLEGSPHAHKMSLEGGHRPNKYLSEVKKIMRKLTKGKTSADTFFKAIGGVPAKGYQLRYIYFIDKEKRKDLTVKEIPYCKIQEIGASMYKGQRAET